MVFLIFFVLSATSAAGVQSKTNSYNVDNVALHGDADKQADSSDAVEETPTLAMVIDSNGETHGDSISQAPSEVEDASGEDTSMKLQNEPSLEQRRLLSRRGQPACAKPECESCLECFKKEAQSENCGGLYNPENPQCIDPKSKNGGKCKKALSRCGKNNCVTRALCSSPCVCDSWKCTGPAKKKGKVQYDRLRCNAHMSSMLESRSHSQEDLGANASKQQSDAQQGVGGSDWMELQNSMRRSALDTSLQDKCSG